MLGRSVGLAIVSALLFAVPAAATPITYQLSGTVLEGRDDGGLFGGGDLAGNPFAATVTFDPASAQSSWLNASGSGANGGTGANGAHFATVDLSIQGVSVQFADYSSSLSSVAGSQFTTSVQSSAIGGNNIGFNVASDRIETDYTQPNLIEGLTDTYAGYFVSSNADNVQVVWANFEVERLAVVSAVPIPASAPLFGAGLVMLAVIATRQRRTALTLSRLSVSRGR